MTVRMVALPRGINVGRGKPVEMARLRDLLSGRGYQDVRTYLRSGNAVFSCDPGAAATAAADIEQALARELGLESRVIVRAAAEMADAIAADPLLDLVTDPARHLVGFLSADPDPAAVRGLAAWDFSPDQVRIVGRQMYLWCPAGVSASPFSKLNWDRTLGVVVTMRNWNTVTKLATLATEP